MPIIIHKRDLARIAPRWLAKTIEIRDDRRNWLPNWNNRTASAVSSVQTGPCSMRGRVLQCFARRGLGSVQNTIMKAYSLGPFTVMIFFDISVSKLKFFLKDSSLLFGVTYCLELLFKRMT